jgi:hypothetical protein
MNGVVLEPSEFLYLLRTFNARAVVGIDGSRLFPTDPTSEETMLADGFQKLQEHGYLRPAERAGRFHMDEGVTLLVAVVADPEYVILTARNTSETGRVMANHYLAGRIIVELAAEPDGRYRLANVPDLPTTVARIEQVLGVPAAANGHGPSQFSIDTAAFASVQRLAASGQRDAALAALREHGAPGSAAEGLVSALQSPAQGGTLLVVRQERGQVTVGRKADLFRSANQVWLAKKTEPPANTLNVEIVAAGSFAATVDQYLSALKPAPAAAPAA